MTRLLRFVTFLWDFVVGDDWRIAVSVTAALLVTLLLADSGVVAWWLLPAVVAAMLILLVFAVARTRR